jgi:hypothetical protein
MVKRSTSADAQSLRGLTPTHIQRDNYSKGSDGAVRILFSNPSRKAATYLELFEDCSLQWREERDIADGVNGGSRWVRIGRTVGQQ